MATQDLSRSAYDARKHYAGVHMQQGRVLVDDDWNDAERIESEERRRQAVEIVGPEGTPNDGFRISGPTVAGGQIDFTIGAGSFYVGGLRAELEQEQRYGLQRDWLSQPASERQAPAAERTDLVYLLCWQQVVNAVEDAELFEVALGGPDTSTRIRTMARVAVRPDVGTDDCRDAWEALAKEWEADGTGALTPENEVATNATLTIGFEPGGDPDDLCTPFAAGGYLGAENQAIRVQIRDTGSFVWGFDNASALYRATVGADGTTVTLLTEPKDHLHWPLPGQTVEVLPWSAVLPNGEKVAEVQGHLARVDAAYDPDTRELTLATPLPAGFGSEWESRSDRADLGDPFFYLRVWDRGSDTASTPAIAFTPGTPVSLAGTGLTVQLDGDDFRSGDHWIVAARPQTPNQVVPWQLEQGKPADGFRLFAAPLALVRWPAGDGAGEVVSDCRVPFRPLTRLRSCCTYTVGDGVRSHGDFTSVQAAVDALPSGGGEICLLPGEYVESVRLDGRYSVTIRGCGRHVTLRPPDGSTEPALRITNASSRITLESFAIDSPDSVAVDVDDGTGIRLADLDIVARARSAVRVAPKVSQAEKARTYRVISDVAIVDNRIWMPPFFRSDPRPAGAGLEAAVFVAAEDVRIEGNAITTGRPGNDAVLGGIQIGGGSERVDIRRNRIGGGNGNGITLGSVLWVREEDRSLSEEDWNKFVPTMKAGFVEAGQQRILAIGVTVTVDDSGCVSVTDEPEEPKDPDDGTPLVPVSAGALKDIRIVDNTISDMGADGIGVARFFDLGRSPELITSERLTIAANRIERCLQLPRARLRRELQDVVGHGGIALADCDDLVIEDNLIAANGRSHIDPVCGIFVLQGEGVAIERNRILENGPRVQGEEAPRAGNRGGIVIRLASAPLLPSGAKDGRLPLTSGYPAARVHGNIVIVPEGRALQLVAIGPVAVEGNQLVSRGTTALAALFRTLVSQLGQGDDTDATPSRRTFADFLGGAAVSIVELGVSMEMYGQVSGFSTMSGAYSTSSYYASDTALTPGLFATGGLLPSALERGRRLAGGQVLFNDNQVSLDLREAEQTGTLSSVLVLSLDDVSFHGNQCECDLLADFVLTNALVLAWSLRMADNRFQEGTQIAYLSALTLGMLNSTTDNQGTHCILAAGHPNLTEREHNRSLVEMAASDRSVCERLAPVARHLGEILFAARAQPTYQQAVIN